MIVHVWFILFWITAATKCDNAIVVFICGSRNDVIDTGHSHPAVITNKDSNCSSFCFCHILVVDWYRKQFVHSLKRKQLHALLTSLCCVCVCIFGVFYMHVSLCTCFYKYWRCWVSFLHQRNNNKESNKNCLAYLCIHFLTGRSCCSWPFIWRKFWPVSDRSGFSMLADLKELYCKCHGARYF